VLHDPSVNVVFVSLEKLNVDLVLWYSAYDKTPIIIILPMIDVIIKRFSGPNINKKIRNMENMI
jgi:hypothetical protein